MPRRSTRSKIKISARREQAIELYESGMNMSEVAAYLGVNRSMISRDIAAMDAERVKRSAETLDKRRQREIAKTLVTEMEAREAWQRSIGTHTTVKEERRGVSVPDEDADEDIDGIEMLHKRNLETVELVGDPRFLTVILNCIQERAKLDGLYAPAKQEVSGVNGGPIETNNVVIYLPDNGRDKADD